LQVLLQKTSNRNKCMATNDDYHSSTVHARGSSRKLDPILILFPLRGLHPIFKVFKFFHTTFSIAILLSIVTVYHWINRAVHE
jgi:hypothetical protein